MIDPIKTHEILIESLKRHIKNLEFQYAQSRDPLQRKNICREITRSKKGIRLHQESIDRLKGKPEKKGGSINERS